LIVIGLSLLGALYNEVDRIIRVRRGVHLFG
jgi:hypothetical protein